MIIHHSENLDEYHLCVKKPLKYSDKFTFIPIQLQKDNNYHKCIFQTPLLFTPFGTQVLMNGKKVIDLSFMNQVNDNSQREFLKKLNHIYQCVNYKYKGLYKVNVFLKGTDFNECIRLKMNNNTSLYDETKNRIETIDKFTYGYYIIELEGLWLNENDIWFQWNLLQAKVKIPTHLKGYSFIEEIKETIPDKYEKMLRLGVPKEAVSRQKILDEKGISKIPPPPPPPPSLCMNNNKNKSNDIPKIKASDLRSVTLKKTKPITKKIIIKDPNHFEPPTLEELQTTLSRLRPTK
jgi:hypothetical protein